jgi:hypothetical protein
MNGFLILAGLATLVLVIIVLIVVLLFQVMRGDRNV